MRLDILWAVRSWFQLFTKRSHEHAQRGDVALAGTAPHAFDEKAVRQHLAHVLREHGKQAVLDRRQMQLLAIDTGAPRRVIHTQFPVDKDGACRRAAGLHIGQAATGHAKARQQLLYGKRLCQVIIRPRVQRIDLIRILASCGDNDDRQIAPGPYTTDDIHAIQIRQSKVEQDDIRIMRGCSQYGALTVRRGQIAIVVYRERRGDQVSYRRIVHNDQNQRLAHAFYLHRAK